MTSGTYKSEISSGSRKMPVTTDATDANVKNSLKFGNANRHYRMPPDPCGSYRHSFREQSQGNQPVVVQAAQLALVSTLPVDLPHRKPQTWTIPDDETNQPSPEWALLRLARHATQSRLEPTENLLCVTGRPH